MPLIVDTTYNADVAQTLTKDIDLSNMEGVCITATYANAAPAAKIFAPSAVDATANTITIAAQPYVTGTKGQLTTATTLPGGLSTSTDYFVIKVSATVIKLASSLANAVAGTAIDITDQGTGNHTFTATTSTGNVLKLQAGNDGTGFEDISGETVTIATTSGTKVWNHSSVYYKYIRILYTPSAGQITLKLDTAYRLKG